MFNHSGATAPMAQACADTSPHAAQELHIGIQRDEWAQYEGTAAQLQAEGLIPEGFEWPRARDDCFWQANGFEYWLRRTRPKGHKGPMRSWLGMDNWFIRVVVHGRDVDWRTRRHLQRKAEEFCAECHRHSAEGKRQWSDAWRRHWEALNDLHFQAFKAKIPGLTQPKRGREPKTEATLGAGLG
jgi:hypothetical protein